MSSLSASITASVHSRAIAHTIKPRHLGLRSARPFTVARRPIVKTFTTLENETPVVEDVAAPIPDPALKAKGNILVDQLLEIIKDTGEGINV